jgi:hypothetical protein
MVLMLSSYNYLGLIGDPRMMAQQSRPSRSMVGRRWVLVRANRLNQGEQHHDVYRENQAATTL